MSNNAESSDIVIIGGGLAGLTIAAPLASNVIERSSKDFIYVNSQYGVGGGIN